LARIGGLHCPSELKHLRWSDINWAENRFLVHSPKTEHHEGHRERLVPLFPELRKELERHFTLDEVKDNEFVIQGLQNSTRWNLHHPIKVIAKRAGLGTIMRPFDNMRMTRSNEVDREFGSVKESLWIGHSERVKKEHY
jgi:integrase